MKTEVFTVYDSAARLYLEPFFAETVEVALRMFRVLVNKEGHSFNRWPQDYVLFHVGSYNAEVGELFPMTPHSIAVGITCVESKVSPLALEA